MENQSATLPADRPAWKSIFSARHLAATLMVSIAVTLILLRSWDMDIYRHAMRLLAESQSPYKAWGFHNPPWALLFMIPTLIISREATVILFGMISLVVLCRLIDPLPRFQAAVILLSPWVLLSASYINLDWIVLLGAFLPPIWGIWLLALKPQAGGVLVALLLWQAWQRRDQHSRLEKIDYVVFVICFGLYLLLAPHPDPVASITAGPSIFPWGIPIGIALTAVAFRKKDRDAALAAAPCLSPYVGFGSWLAVLPFASRNKWILYGVVLVGWIVAVAGNWP